METNKEITLMNYAVWKNRQRFVDFSHENDLTVENTMYSKRTKNSAHTKIRTADTTGENLGTPQTMGRSAVS